MRVCVGVLVSGCRVLFDLLSGAVRALLACRQRHHLMRWECHSLVPAAAREVVGVSLCSQSVWVVLSSGDWTYLQLLQHISEAVVALHLHDDGALIVHGCSELYL